MTSDAPFQAAREGFAFSDIPSVLAAIQRQKLDMQDLAAEANAAGAALARAIAAPGDKAGARRALEHQQAQLVWLAAETGAMLAALAEATEEQAMSGARASEPLITDPVNHLYTLAESLEHLGETLPDPQAGLALLLRIIGEEVKECARQMDDAE